ncbi:hypothetical protein BC938DRAFT_480394 [Jimgerdemannia flammicorona]|uniref:Uncharacterized protein n=1 Tax=Jimgerdemannia flammicorona TaxID=994334 RepID=A0A433QIN5_9FUNG|nr:hypothetical protein BC938DRAFT_480394 [Jimgerdemannia flammicorona]
MHHQDLIAVTSRWTLVDAVGGSARGGELFAWELGLKFSVTPHKLYGRQAACCLSDGLRALVCEGEGELPRTTRDGKSRAAVLKDCVSVVACLVDLNLLNHRKKYDEVDLFWIAIEEEEAVRTKILSVKKVYDCATIYTEEVFETAADNLIVASERHTAADATDKYTSWEFDGEPPSWLSKAIKEYESSTSEVEMQAINWKIVNASDRNYLLTFLTEDEFLSLNSIFGSAINGWKILAPAAERCLQTLAKVKEMLPNCIAFCSYVFAFHLTYILFDFQLNNSQLQSIGRIILIEGVRGAVKQTLHLVGNAMASEEPSLDGDDSDNDGKNAASVDLLKEEDYNHTDVCYIFNLLRYCCEMLDKGIPQRNNSERDIDIAIKAHIFSCLDNILDKHYGEIVSRASRNRRTLAIGASKNAEGYHVDWLFTRHDLAKDSAWGREFSLCERAGSTVENRQKISSDTMKVQKTLRDMHQSLYNAITEAGNGALSKSVLNQTTKLLMPGFISSYFFVRTLLVLYVGAGFYASLDLAEFDIPTTTKEIENILKVARIMLQIKKIMVSTVARFRKMEERAIQERFGGENVVIHGRQPEHVTPKKKKKIVTIR